MKLCTQYEHINVCNISFKNVSVYYGELKYAHARVLTFRLDVSLTSKRSKVYMFQLTRQDGAKRFATIEC
jgi:hypothetical protein